MSMHPRQTGVILAAFLVVSACARTGSNATDSTAGTSAAGVSTAGAPAPGAPAATASSSGTSAAASSASKQRGADLPQRKRDSTPPKVDNPCGGIHVNVMVRASALTQGSTSEVALRSVATDLIAGVRDQVDANSLQLSPAIRTFRVTARDQTAANLVVARLGQSARVESAEADQCIRRQ